MPLILAALLSESSPRAPERLTPPQAGSRVVPSPTREEGTVIPATQGSNPKVSLSLWLCSKVVSVAEIKERAFLSCVLSNSLPATYW